MNTEDITKYFIKNMTVFMANECVNFLDTNLGKDTTRTFTMREILDYCYKAEKEVLNKYDLVNN